MTKHEETCEAPICIDNKNKNTVWWAGEPVCNKRPLTEIQKRQLRINKEFVEGGSLDRCWTLEELSRSTL
jgi:hypothetical protein